MSTLMTRSFALLSNLLNNLPIRVYYNAGEMYSRDLDEIKLLEIER